MFLNENPPVWTCENKTNTSVVRWGTFTYSRKRREWLRNLTSQGLVAKTHNYLQYYYARLFTTPILVENIRLRFGTDEKTDTFNNQ